VGLNYASAVEQSQVDIKVDEVAVVDDQVTVVVTVPNEMRSAMEINSIVVDLTVNETEFVRALEIVRQEIPPGETARFRVSIERGKLSAEQFRQASSIRLEGVFRASAFSGYEVDLSIDETTVSSVQSDKIQSRF